MITRTRLSLIVFSGDFERVHYALAMASAAAATDRPVTLFFSGGALHFFLAKAKDGAPGWATLGPAADGTTAIQRNKQFSCDGIGTIEEITAACIELNVLFYQCEMGIKGIRLDATTFRSDIPTQSGGLVSFLIEAERDQSQLIFI